MNPFGLIWANLHRRPVRTYLTLFSVLVAFLLFTILRTMAAWFETGGASLAGMDRLLTTAKYSIIESLPISQRQQILAVDGVDAVTHQTWFGGNYQDRSNFFPKYPVEPRAYFEMYPEMLIDPAELAAFERTRTGTVVSADLMARFGWQLGDKIPIEADIYPLRDGDRLWQLDLVGSFVWDQEDGGQSLMLFHYDYFDEARAFGEGSVGWWTVRIADPDRAPEIASAIDELFQNSLNPTKTATEDEFTRSFAAQIGDIGLMANGILSAVFFTILLLTANTMAQALRERIPELAVLKTLGFTNARVSRLVLGESVLLCTLGGVLGVGLALVVAPGLSAVMAMLNFPGFVTSWWTAAVGVGLAALIGVVVGAHPAWSANRLTIANALRRV